MTREFQLLFSDRLKHARVFRWCLLRKCMAEQNLLYCGEVKVVATVDKSKGPAGRLVYDVTLSPTDDGKAEIPANKSGTRYVEGEWSEWASHFLAPLDLKGNPLQNTMLAVSAAQNGITFRVDRTCLSGHENRSWNAMVAFAAEPFVQKLDETFASPVQVETGIDGELELVLPAGEIPYPFKFVKVPRSRFKQTTLMGLPALSVSLSDCMRGIRR